VLERIGRAFEAGADLLEIKARIAALTVAEVGAALAAFLLGALIALVAVLGLLAALAVALWELLGAAGALAVTSGLAALCALAILLAGRSLIRRVGSPPPDSSVRQEEHSIRDKLNLRVPGETAALRAERRLLDQQLRRIGASAPPPPPPPPVDGPAAGPDSPSEPPTGSKSTDPKMAFAAKALEHPKKSAAAAFAVLAILGPKRASKMITKGMALASVAASAAKFTTEAMDQAEPRSPEVDSRSRPHSNATAPD
jgi:hypothetical protein